MNTRYRDITTGRTGIVRRLCATVLLLAVLFTITACSNDDEAVANEPSPATVRMVFMPNMMRGITDANENDIRDLSVFIFDNTGTCIGYKYNSSPTYDNDKHGYVVNINTHEASNCTLYAIANIAETETAFNTLFAGKITQSAIDAMTQTISTAAELGNGDYLPMFGRTVSTITIARSTTAQDIGKIEMEHVCSKIKLNIKPKSGENITINGYRLHHVPLSTYISDKKGYYDYIGGTVWASPSGTYADFDSVAVNSTTDVTKTYYMYENMVGNGKDTSSPTAAKRYVGNAAANATYLIIGAQTQAWKSGYYVYLGTVGLRKSIATNGTLTYTTTTADSDASLYNNYDVYRNGEYTVTVNIDGSGVTDARVDYKPTTIIYTITLDAWDATVDDRNVPF